MSLQTALRAGSGRRVRTLSLEAPGARLAAWLVTPDADAPPPWPLVVMAHGWAAVKEMNLDYFAAAMADAGLAALVFDHRGFGASEGLRGDIDPERQIDDYRFALGAAQELEDVDPRRLGVWGTSYSGGHVCCVAHRDERVRAAVAQVPTISGSESTRRRSGDENLPALKQAWERERATIAAGYPPRSVPAADTAGHEVPGANDPENTEATAPQELPPAPTGLYTDEERWRFYVEMPRERRRTWRNRVTLLSQERYAGYEPGRELAHLTVPMLVIYADADTITPTDLIRDATAHAPACVETLEVSGGHYAVYAAHRDRAARAAAAFLSGHLSATAPAGG